MDGKKVIGYKIGYEIDKRTFYSWMGGVDPDYRGRGIAFTLMEKQHQYLKEEYYKVVRTKTMNRWRNMLVLNIKMDLMLLKLILMEKDSKLSLRKDCFTRECNRLTE